MTRSGRLANTQTADFMNSHRYKMDRATRAIPTHLTIDAVDLLFIYCRGRGSTRQFCKRKLRDGKTMSEMQTACPITDARSIRVGVEGERITVDLVDGRTLFIPVSWSRRLNAASSAQRKNVRIIAGGLTLDWPDIDERVNVSCLLG